LNISSGALPDAVTEASLRAARAHGLPKTLISRRVQDLETRLGAQLNQPEFLALPAEEPKNRSNIDRRIGIGSASSQHCERLSLGSVQIALTRSCSR